jgi:hypothetical protein
MQKAVIKKKFRTQWLNLEMALKTDLTIESQNTYTTADLTSLTNNEIKA